MSCIFCRIAGGEIPAEVVAQDDRTLAYLDVSPLADGHVLVVPRAHVALLEDLVEEDARAVLALTARLARAVRESVGAVGTTIGINNGPGTGQTIPHVHVHIVPRREGDGGGSVHTIFRTRPTRPIADVASEIRRRIAS